MPNLVNVIINSEYNDNISEVLALPGDQNSIIVAIKLSIKKFMKRCEAAYHDQKLKNRSVTSLQPFRACY